MRAKSWITRSTIFFNDTAAVWIGDGRFAVLDGELIAKGEKLPTNFPFQFGGLPLRFVSYVASTNVHVNQIVVMRAGAFASLYIRLFTLWYYTLQPPIGKLESKLWNIPEGEYWPEWTVTRQVNRLFYFEYDREHTARLYAAQADHTQKRLEIIKKLARNEPERIPFDDFLNDDTPTFEDPEHWKADTHPLAADPPNLSPEDRVILHGTACDCRDCSLYREQSRILNRSDEELEHPSRPDCDCRNCRDVRNVIKRLTDEELREEQRRILSRSDEERDAEWKRLAALGGQPTDKDPTIDDDNRAYLNEIRKELNSPTIDEPAADSYDERMRDWRRSNDWPDEIGN